VPGAERAHDAVENSLDDDFAVFTGQLRQPGNFVDEVGFGHFRATPFPRKSRRRLGLTTRTVIRDYATRRNPNSGSRSRIDPLTPQVIEPRVFLEQLRPV